MFDFEENVKGQITQSLFKTLLETVGYRVVRLGIEEQLAEIKYVDFCKYAELDLPEALRALPDFLVLDLDTPKSFLVEIKYRARFDAATASRLYEKIKHQKRFWPDTLTVLMIGRPFEVERGYHQDHIRVIGPQEIEYMIDCQLLEPDRWEHLEMLQRVFTKIGEQPSHWDYADWMTRALKALETGGPINQRGQGL